LLSASPTGRTFIFSSPAESLLSSHDPAAVQLELAKSASLRTVLSVQLGGDRGVGFALA
jgi:hypothetical protein